MGCLPRSGNSPHPRPPSLRYGAPSSGGQHSRIIWPRRRLCGVGVSTRFQFVFSAINTCSGREPGMLSGRSTQSGTSVPPVSDETEDDGRDARPTLSTTGSGWLDRKTSAYLAPFGAERLFLFCDFSVGGFTSSSQEFFCPLRAEVCTGATDFRNSETLCSQFICR